MKIKRSLFLMAICIWGISQSQAQPRPVQAPNDSAIKHHAAEHTEHKKQAPKRLEYFRDTIRRERRKFDSTLFKKVSVPSNGDYAEELSKVYQLLSTVPEVTAGFVKLKDIHDEMDRGDDALDVLKERMSQKDRSLNVRNLQMFNTLLDALHANVSYYAFYLNQYDSSLDRVRKQ